MAKSDPRRITRTMPATQLVALLLAFVLAAGVGGVLAAGLVIPMVAGANAAADSTVAIYDEVPAELEPRPMSQQSRIYAANGKLLATFYAQNRVVVPIDEISESMQHAVIAIEDERFYEHGGIDVQGMTRALANNVAGHATQGASTLTQQYVKNMLIDQALQDGDQFAVIQASEDSISRKLTEAKMAISLEKTMSKDEVLQGYLNAAQFGSRSIYGVEAAARYYFDKHASELNVVEAATIAGITKSPSRFDPTVNPKDAKERRDIVLQNMWKLGYISTEERDEAKATSIKKSLDVNPTEIGCSAAGDSAFFCDYVTKEIVNNPVFGETKSERQQLLYRGGLEIHTTLDPKKQKAAAQSVEDAVNPGDASGLQSAIVSVEPGTGKILAMAQNIPYTPSEGGKNTTRVNYSADPTHGASGGFQVGSNFKPFVLAEWLKEGHTLSERVNATKTARWPQNFQTPCVGNLAAAEPWAPANSEGVEVGYISALEATYESVNTAYAAMGYQLNLCDLRTTAWDMGFRPTRSVQDGGRVVTAPEETDIDIQAPMIIGTQESTPLYQAAAYATLASGGTYCSPIAITSVTGPGGKDYDVPDANCDKDALPENVANTVVYAMEKVFSGTGTARALGGLSDGRPVAGKTGTSQLSAQTWFTGFTPNLSTSVWVGNADKPNEDHTSGNVVNGQYHRILYGSTIAAPAWKQYMDQAVDGMPVEDFGNADPDLVGVGAIQPSTPDDGGDDSSDEGDGDNGGDEGKGDEGNDRGGNGNGRNDAEAAWDAVTNGDWDALGDAWGDN
ncbi:transglycosylase domain-containing protein [Krasilnikoviella flava]|uniref:Membrane carboxypeptidase (Penicillin-binding protein) n=1 Tax=Krasilnikoviella flava TaxID=526729 RepID=A0A1T5IMJ9_9MICO|nr:transglycosylase domain-containing protein [Krasilnikoviella flava]SKC40411.1 Membrane carboxypeptidase (penicillin-binding protein) [Krasilnikoviella flava]